jgi:predicted transcriptional regulator
MVSISDVLKVLMDDKCLDVFNSVASSRVNSVSILRKKLGLTRKQYYSIIHNLRNAGLILTRKRKPQLSYFGIVVYEVQKLLLKGVQEYDKLQTIDSIQTKDDTAEMPIDERNKIINAMIKAKEIRDLLLSHTPANK